MTKDDIKIVILCGGKGYRFKGHMDGIPKPLAPIGNKPMLWHIMKIYEYHGFKNFILCLGYLGGKIKDYFKDERKWNIIFAETGLNTNTGGRIKKIKDYIEEDIFFVTYGDGLSDLDLDRLLEFHKKKNKIATITCIKPNSPFGMVQINRDNSVSSFKEKPVLNQWINGGFFVFNKEVFDYIGENEILEKDPFERLAKADQMSAYKFRGFWNCMDNYKDHLILNELWNNGNPPWAKWTVKKEKK